MPAILCFMIWWYFTISLCLTRCHARFLLLNFLFLVTVREGITFSLTGIQFNKVMEHVVKIRHVMDILQCLKCLVWIMFVLWYCIKVIFSCLNITWLSALFYEIMKSNKTMHGDFMLVITPNMISHPRKNKFVIKFTFCHFTDLDPLVIALNFIIFVPNSQN